MEQRVLIGFVNIYSMLQSYSNIHRKNYNTVLWKHLFQVSNKYKNRNSRMKCVLTFGGGLREFNGHAFVATRRVALALVTDITSDRTETRCSPSSGLAALKQKCGQFGVRNG
ncbi:hypothetical protein CEXT_296971 [Caerostris extrusa]|uniref:Uncharacterized protein n=1 Tax=Caerostris extrusa TaxID=172846 RepID=A0AAV4NUP8_CAEEX|nr:hypothetical protein CEXT_296971 [Caerostris extrusa]